MGQFRKGPWHSEYGGSLTRSLDCGHGSGPTTETNAAALRSRRRIRSVLVDIDVASCAADREVIILGLGVNPCQGL